MHHSNNLFNKNKNRELVVEVKVRDVVSKVQQSRKLDRYFKQLNWKRSRTRIKLTSELHALRKLINFAFRRNYFNYTQNILPCSLNYIFAIKIRFYAEVLYDAVLSKN